MVSIYSLTHHSSDRIYIGKTVKPLKERLQCHLSEARNRKNKSKKLNWIRHLIKQNLIPNINFIAEVDDSEWKEKEQYYIKLGWQVAPNDMLNSPFMPGGEGFGPRGRYKEDYVHVTYTKNCPVCKKIFINNAKKKHNKFCSRQCSNQWSANSSKFKTKRRKIFQTDLIEIAKRINNGEYIKDIAKEYNVHFMTIVKNLKGQTLSTNKIDYKKHHPAGIRHGNSKITPETAEKIRKEYSNGKIYQYQLAEKYNVAQSSIWSILKNKTWKT